MTTSGGRNCRRSGDVADINLVATGQVSSAVVTLAGGKGEAQAWHDNGGDLVQLGSTPFDSAPGVWMEIAIPLSEKYEPGNPLHIRLDAPGGVDVTWASTA